MLPETIPLKDVSLFKDLSPRQLTALKPYLKEKKFEKGESLFFEGDPCERIFIVQSGRVKVFRLSVSGKEQILEVLEKGDSCACNPASKTWSCFASAQALTPVRAWLISREHYARMLKDDAALMQQLNQLLARRMCRFCALIEELALDAPDRRLAKFLLDMAETNGSPAGKDCVPFTHEEISQRIGLVRETVSRHLQKFKRLDLIELKPQQIRVVNRAGLQRMVHAS